VAISVTSLLDLNEANDVGVSRKVPTPG